MLSKVPIDISNYIYNVRDIICPIPNDYKDFGIYLFDLSNTPWLLNSFNSAKYTDYVIVDTYPDFITSNNSITINVISDISYSSFTIVDSNNINMIGNIYYTNTFDISNFLYDVNWYLILASTDINNRQYSIFYVDINEAVWRATSPRTRLTRCVNAKPSAG